MFSSKNRTTLKKVLNYIRRYWILFIFSLLLAVVTVVTTLYLPVLTGQAIDYITSPGQVAFTKILPILAKAAGIILTTSAAQWLMNLCNNKICYSVSKDIRNDAMAKIQQLPLQYVDSHSSGDLVSRVIADVDQFADGLLMGFTQLFTGVITILGTILFMLSIHPGITCVVVFLTPLSFWVAGFIAKRIHTMFQLQSETRGKQTALIDEAITGQKVVAAYSQEQAIIAQFDAINTQLQDYSLKATFFSSITNPATRCLNSLVYAGVGVTGALFAIHGRLSIGELSCFLSYANQYTKPFNEISGVITELQNALVCAGRILELIEEPAQTPDAPDAFVLQKADGKVSFSHVDFSYLPKQKLITDFNLQVQPGQRVAIVGPTGSGKSTLINLLMRFYEPNSGTIHIDDQEIRHITRESLRENFGMILQETWLKAGTIRENLLMGKPDATEEELQQAARAAHADGFIRRLPQGYDTYIGEDGGSLSQGQKQLLCIARVMLHLPPMLILDEATSSIDTRTEWKIQNAFAAMMKGRTSFIVAHRLSTIQNADIILVLKDGQIIEQGDHETLLAQNGFYSHLYQSQFTV